MTASALTDVAARRNASLSRRLRVAWSGIAHRLFLAGGKAWPAPIAWRLQNAIQDGRLVTIHAPSAQSRSARPRSARHALLVSHELSLSGAPILLREMASILIERGWDVTLLSPHDGDLRDNLTAAGVSVLVDPNAELSRRATARALARGADVVVCNTVATRWAVEAVAAVAPSLWYLHEVSLIEQWLQQGDGLDRTFALPRALWAGSEASARLVRGFRPDVAVVPYGLEPLAGAVPSVREAGRPLRLAVFGSYERRKGQDLLCDALRLLPADAMRGIELVMFGRVLDADFHQNLLRATADLPNVSVLGELNAEQYRAELLRSDAVVVPSRDDTLPLVSLDALGAGRILMCTATTGTAAYVMSGTNGFVAREASPAALAEMLTSALTATASWSEVAAGGQEVFRRSFSRDAFARLLSDAMDGLVRERS